MPTSDFEDMFPQFDTGSSQRYDDSPITYELAEQGELLHQKLQLAVEERKKYEAMKAAYQAKSQHEELRLERIRLQEAVLKLKQQLIRLRVSLERAREHRHRSEQETFAAYNAFIDFYLKTQAAFTAEYDRKTLEDVLASAAEDNPEVCCPACHYIPTKLLCGQRFCGACGWKPGDEDTTPF